MRARVAGWAAVALAGLGAAWVVARTLVARPGGAVGLDFRPVFDAAAAVLAGRSVYGVHNFVYPPPAALLALPTQLVDRRTALTGYVALELVTYAFLLTVPPRVLVGGLRGWVLAAGAVVAFGLSKTALDVTYLANVSVVLSLLGLVVVLAWSRGRWGAGCAVWALALVVKPLLAPLLLVPLVAGRRREPALAVGAAALACAVALPFVAPVAALPTVARRVLGGSNLVGGLSVRNLSLVGVGRVHGVPGPVITLSRLAVLAVVLLLLVRVSRSGLLRLDQSSRARWSFAVVSTLSGLLLVGLFLAGSLAESHYLVALLPAVYGTAALGWRSRGWRRPAVLVGVAVTTACLVYRPAYLGGRLRAGTQVQARLVLAEVALLVAASLALHVATDRHVVTGRTRAGVGDRSRLR